MTLFASLLTLDRKACQALRITDPYSLHRVVYGLFSDTRSDAEKNTSTSSGIQWVDKGGDARGRHILLLSDRKPASSTQAGYGTVKTKSLPANYLSHDHYRFDVLVNPVRRHGQSRKLLPVKGREAIGDWFIERAAQSWGFAIKQKQVNTVNVLQFKDKHQRPVTIQQAHLTGTLMVTDRDAFECSVARGIGRGRSFGCGLLQIVPV